MSQSISVVINTLNDEKNITRAIKSAIWVDEILVCDMHSEDKTTEVAKKLGARVIFHKKVNFVEPARNFAISKAMNPWILILDPDEEVSPGLTARLKEIMSKQITSDYVEVSRKNIIFGQWIKATGWWPDYQIRLFKKGAVIWQDKIHSKPQTKGVGLTLPAQENLAIIHHNYQTISQFILRMNRYTEVESKQLKDQGYIFNWTDLIHKPVGEFLSRFFVNRGYEDGLHGLVLSLLQSFSFLVVYLKLWESSKFKENKLDLEDIEIEQKKVAQQFNYWVKQTKKQENIFKKFIQRVTRRK